MAPSFCSGGFATLKDVSWEGPAASWRVCWEPRFDPWLRVSSLARPMDAYLSSKQDRSGTDLGQIVGEDSNPEHMVLQYNHAPTQSHPTLQTDMPAGGLSQFHVHVEKYCWDGHSGFSGFTKHRGMHACEKLGELELSRLPP